MKLYYGKDLSVWNTFGMKVSCACFVEYSSVARLQEFWKAWRSGEHVLPKPFLHIGRGSNLLFTGDFPGTVFHSDIKFIREYGKSREEGDETAVPRSSEERPGTAGRPAESSGVVLVEAGAGVLWDDFCRWCADNSLWGPENLSGIPGETGAAAVQNIGAYGVEVKDIVKYVKCFDCVTGAAVTFRASECRYGYRDSMFKSGAKGRYVVTSVVFSLSAVPVPRLGYGHVRAAVEKVLGRPVPDVAGCPAGSAESSRLPDGLTASMVRDVILDIRNSKLPDPAVMGSAGSFFKNPVVPRSDYERVASVARLEHGMDCEVPHYDAGSGFIKIPAAWLIDQCGLKGFRDGNAGVYEKQPLVLVNLTGKASPEEILYLENLVRNAVVNKFGIMLQPEVEHV